MDSRSPDIVPTRIGGSLSLEFDHPDYKGSSLFKRPSRMSNKINLIETKTDLKLILKIYQINNYLILKGMKRVTRDRDNYLQNSLHFLESATFVS